MPKQTQKKHWKRWMYPLFHRRVVVLLALLIQILLLIYMHLTSIAQFRFLYLFSMGISVLSVLFIITRQKESAYKLPWIMLIAMMPAFGGLLFVFVHAQSSTKRLTRRFDEVNRILAPYCPQNEAITDRYAEVIRAESQRSHYLTRHGYPIYAAEDVEFLPSGEDMFARLCEELRRAEHFIFMEYFIVAAGEMWDEIHAILLERVAAGVEVRLIYDDMGSFFRQPYRYDRTLCAEGIDTILFNPFRPAVSALQNNRDHRKITVIDGRIAFTGGINLGDEYINRTSRFGRWNDTAVAIEGEAVRSFTAMFLQMWHCSRPGEVGDLSRYFPAPTPADPQCPRGFVQPYADIPLDGESVGAWVYDHILRTASDYVWIATPYLIIDDALCTTLSLAAKSGVDVRIVVPGVPDKKLVYATTRSYYLPLIEAGVKIYEYTPGFLHAKVVLSDDRIATVGTVNLDYRSLYLHFECGAWMTDTDATPAIRAYFENTFAVSRQVSADELRRNLPARIFGTMMQLFAPFM